MANLKTYALAALLCFGIASAQSQTEVRFLSSRPGDGGGTCSESQWPYLYIVGGTGTGAQNMMDCRAGVWVEMTTGTGTFARASSPAFIGTPTVEDAAGDSTVDIDCTRTADVCEIYMDSGGTNGETMYFHNRGGPVVIQGCGAGVVGPVCAASDENVSIISNNVILGDGAAKDAVLLFDLDADQSFLWDESADAFSMTNDLTIGANAAANVVLTFDTDVDEELTWADSANEFVLSKGLAMTGASNTPILSLSGQQVTDLLTVMEDTSVLSEARIDTNTSYPGGWHSPDGQRVWLADNDVMTLFQNTDKGVLSIHGEFNSGDGGIMGGVVGFGALDTLTATNPPAQGSGALTVGVETYVVTVVGTADDCVTLPDISSDLRQGFTIRVVNDDATERMRVYPASGDDLGNGTTCGVCYATVLAQDLITCTTISSTEWVCSQSTIE